MTAAPHGASGTHAIRQAGCLRYGSALWADATGRRYGLAQLEGLNLDRCPGVADLAPLAGLTQLQNLDLFGCSGLDAEAVAAGYELTVGTTESLCRNFVAPNLTQDKRFCITQEFGTVPTIVVGKVCMDRMPA